MPLIHDRVDERHKSQLNFLLPETIFWGISTLRGSCDGILKMELMYNLTLSSCIFLIQLYESQEESSVFIKQHTILGCKSNFILKFCTDLGSKACIHSHTTNSVLWNGYSIFLVEKNCGLTQ